MNKILEIGSYALAAAAFLGGGYLGATALFDDQAPGAAAARPSAKAPETALIRNEKYGFAFRYPKEWVMGPRANAAVQESVARRDGVVCLVSVLEGKVAGDASGRPRNLARHMAGLKKVHLERLRYIDVQPRVETFEQSTLGGQEARSFILRADTRAGAIKLQGHATLRNFGAVFLVCSAPERIFAQPEAQAAFQLVTSSFSFFPHQR